MKLEKLTVLCTSSGGTGFNGIFKSLKQVGERRIKIIAVDASSNAPSMFLADENFTVPYSNHPNFIDSLLDICERKSVDVIIPFSPHDLEPLSKNIEKFERIGTKILISNYRLISKFNNKETMLEFFKKNKINIPKYFEVNSPDEFKEAVKKLGFPKSNVCFKPTGTIGGGRGFRIITPHYDEIYNLINEKNDFKVKFDTLMNMFKNSDYFRPFIVSEYLPGDEYSVDVLADEGKPLIIIPRLRVTVSNGSSQIGIVHNNPKIIKICKDIIIKSKLSYNVNIQIKYSEKSIPKIIEINPRVSGTISLCTAAGVNMVYLGIKLLLGEKIEIPKIRWNTKMIRYPSEVYEDEKGFSYTF